MRVLFDTNIFIEHLHGAAHVAPFFAAVQHGSYEIAVSVVTEYELLRFPRIDASEEDEILLLTAPLHVLGIDRHTARLAALISRGHPNIGMADTFIAATAIANGLPLLTRNVRDFRKIHELKLLTEPPIDAGNSV